MKYGIFLDDERNVEKFMKNFSNVDEVIVCRNYEDFCAIISENGVPSFISFDHDLGQEMTGYDCAKYVIEYMIDNGGEPFDFFVHSANPIGAENIKGYLLSAFRFINERE